MTATIVEMYKTKAITEGKRTHPSVNINWEFTDNFNELMPSCLVCSSDMELNRTPP